LMPDIEWDHKVGVEGEWWERFVGPAPEMGSRFRVIREEWDEDFTHRTIYEWKAA
jgi:hypothetical protein